MNFPSISFKTKARELQIKHFKSDNSSILKAINNAHILKMVSIITPENIKTDEIKTALSDHFYSIANFKIAEIINQNFIEGYIKTGDFFCITNDDEGNNSITLQEKKLKLVLDKDVFYSLGAKNLVHCHKSTKDDLCYFEIDLIHANINGLNSELKSDLLDEIAVTFIWQPTDSDICPSSIAKYFSDAGYSVTALNNKFYKESIFGLQLPDISLVKDEDDNSDFFECLGMTFLKCDMEESAVSSYRLPEKITDAGRGSLIHFKGFICKNTIFKLIHILQDILKQEDSFPYIALSLISCKANHKMLIVTLDSIYVAQ